MKLLWRWLKRLVLFTVLSAVLLASPVVWIETMCRGETVESTYQPILPPEYRRLESRTLMTYPEWHIVHAYDDYAKVISTGDPHDFGYIKSITGFWSSLCALSTASAQYGGTDSNTKQMVYVIGVSFSLELVLKAAYEETIGRIATVIRGETRAPLDEISARQTAEYARFLQQVPWYKWDFTNDGNALRQNSSGTFRDFERQTALGVEYRAKAAYAGVIESAVANVGADQLRLRMIVRGLETPPQDVVVIAERPEGLEIDTPRYRQLTGLLNEMAVQGVEFVEIAGNDDILLTALSGFAETTGAIHSFARQGYGDYRHLIVVKAGELAAFLREMPDRGLTLEHIHDY